MFRTAPATLSAICLGIGLLACAPAACATPPDCRASQDACVRTLIAETAEFMEACGKAFPQSKDVLDSAFQQWRVLELAIPKIEEATKADAQLRASLRESITAYFARIPADEKIIECSGRLDMVRSAEPQLAGDTAKLPHDALSRYAR